MKKRHLAEAKRQKRCPCLLEKSVRVFTFSRTEENACAGVTRWVNELTEAGAEVETLSFRGLRKADGSPVQHLNDCLSIHPDHLKANPALRTVMPA